MPSCLGPILTKFGVTAYQGVRPIMKKAVLSATAYIMAVEAYQSVRSLLFAQQNAITRMPYGRNSRAPTLSRRDEAGAPIGMRVADRTKPDPHAFAVHRQETTRNKPIS